ncbi:MULTISPECIES: thioredoxin family protein [Salimicrobium]|uniref:Thioredoxin n=3 Tax=Salimicrobium TaxID=351195 RepID=K2GBP2_9BACI|nr:MULTISPECIES: thioredoxin family protein [Salimicrobium]AKG05002.1 thiol reductase thioredoxin [Salimicrobium jeotgali]EKE31687.1 thioredoxin [Salimicrobium jeotgali]MBM7696509.1 thioredoxin-like negative regulator of GroEL [Salimicrobium jeotgali]SDX46619.1 Thioredoxin [Salimicrobium album]SIS44709.1 Thioredoxin [Salimicrobium salexigens]
MKKKMIIFAAVLVVLIAALALIVSLQNSEKAEGNPYNKDESELQQSTIDQLENPNYGNQILPDELSGKVESGEEVTVYFYSPECVYCQNTTPYLVPLTEEMGVDMKKMNVLEFPEQRHKYGIEGTPTVVHFENGEEQDRIVGQQPEENFRDFFENNVKGD